jgi:endonuclease/exonuclease/phosphatase family metal-dependent hydrolase
MKRIVTWALIAASFVLLLSIASPYFHPDTLPYLSFFGLLYPVWFMLTLGVTALALILNRRTGYWGLVVLIFSISSNLKIVGIHFNEVTSKDAGIKILSYNARLFGLYDDVTTKTRDSIFQFIRKENPDIVFFQEYFRQDKPTKFETFDSLNSIIKAKDYHERSAHNSRGHRNFGVAIFSKFPMIAKGDVIFDDQSSMDFNFCIFADVVAQKDTFRIYNVHLQSIRLSEPGGTKQPNMLSTLRRGIRKMRTAYKKRANQANKVIDHMNHSPYPVIICGDFNDTPISYTYQQFNKSLTDAFLNCQFGIGRTYIGRIPAGRIDYIFHSPKLASSDFRVHDVTYSDHKPISCKIHFKKE